MDDQTLLQKQFAAHSVAELRRALAFLELPEEEQQSVLNRTFAAKAAPHPAPELRPLPEPGGDYKRIQPFARMSKVELKAFVGGVWGHWLAGFNRDLEIDAMSRDDLRQRDNRLMDRLYRFFTPDELENIIQSHGKKAEIVAKKYPREQLKIAARADSYLRAHGL